jgi:hypothetical protein
MTETDTDARMVVRIATLEAIHKSKKADIPDPAKLEWRLAGLVSVVGRELFIALASTVIVGGTNSITVLDRCGWQGASP